jgi:riboflavin synthase
LLSKGIGKKRKSKMFTGIIEEVGEITEIRSEGSNVHFWVKSTITKELQIDQSVAHNGVCLTVVDINNDIYKVTAIDETLQKTNLGSLEVGNYVNLERSVTLEKRLDGHMVQGHVDTKAECISIVQEDGSWLFTFKVDSSYDELMVEKGSICVNGTSLTIFNIKKGTFNVAIIPYTFENTVFNTIEVGHMANIEFDMMGKYIIKYLRNLQLKS